MTFLSLTVFKKPNRQARLAIFCAEKMQDFQNPHRDWRAVLLQVRTNGLAKYYNISRPGGGQGELPLNEKLIATKIFPFR